MLRRGLIVLALALAVGACGDDGGAAGDAAVAIDGGSDARLGPAPAVIVMIGDGMGDAQRDVASLYRHGAIGRLAMEQLPRRGEVRTGGPSGITDSAAAATTMATGARAYNGAIGIDRRRRPVENLVERAKAHGWATGVVTTAALPHATPAAFTAHISSRGRMVDIAEQQVRETRPNVMLGGGTAWFGPQGPSSYRTDGGLYDAVTAAGYRAVFDTAALDRAVAARAPRLFGAFAPEHLSYVAERTPATTEPTLPAMAEAALATLDRDPDGFFLMIEGGRIDHGGHDNNLVNTVAETLAFDDAVAAVAAWARARGNVTLLVTADHECGGLEVVTPAPAGTYPTVRWRWGNHTNARIGLFGDGPGTDVIDGEVLDHRWIHAIAKGRIDGAPLVAPPRDPVPDGELDDLRHKAAMQRVATGFGAGFNQLDALWLDATVDGLYLGIEGVFEWDKNAVEVLIDVDPGAGTGVRALAGALTDRDGVVDRVLASSRLLAGAAALEADVAVVSLGGADPHVEDYQDAGGIRGLRPPYGTSGDLGWLPAAINFGDVRTRAVARAVVPGQGLEAFVPWTVLYPSGVPAGARLRLAAVLVDSTGGFTSNQFLPPAAAGAANPGATPVALPGVVEYVLDGDGDGAIDGDRPPTVLP